MFIPTIMVPMITFPIVIAARCKHCLCLVNPHYLNSRSNLYVLHNQLSRSASIIKEKPRHSELRIAGLANNQPQTINTSVYSLFSLKHLSSLSTSSSLKAAILHMASMNTVKIQPTMKPTNNPIIYKSF